MTARLVAMHLAAAVCSIVWLISIAGRPAAADTRVLNYTVSVALFGDIGIYQNRIDSTPTATTVTSRLRCTVTFLGIVLHREDADRVERWQNGKLTYFDGTTITNGNAVHVHGEPHGTQFLVSSPKGDFVAPDEVFPSNPWSPAFIRAHALLHVTTGEVEEAMVTVGNDEMLTVAGERLRARPYQIISRLTHATVWLDQRGIPVLMRVSAYGHTVTLKLQSVTDR